MLQDIGQVVKIEDLLKASCFEEMMRVVMNSLLVINSYIWYVAFHAFGSKFSTSIGTVFSFMTVFRIEGE